MLVGEATAKLKDEQASLRGILISLRKEENIERNAERGKQMEAGKEAEVQRSLGGEGLRKFTGKAETNILKCQGSM